jgi:hypothetical protein
MKLVDCVAQYRQPFIVRNQADGQLTTLSNTSDFADQVCGCPLRYVLDDELTRLCAELAYSSGSRSVACSDLLRIPGEKLWIEWCNRPWLQALQGYGFALRNEDLQWSGRRGALIQATRDGRRGLLRTFWTQRDDQEVMTSSVEAYFDFDTPPDEAPSAWDGQDGEVGSVFDRSRNGEDVLGRCFRFRYERSWSEYYRHSVMTQAQREAVWRHSLGTIAMDVPMLLAFFLLLATRGGLPQQLASLDRLNRRRCRVGKAPLLEHIEVRAPVLAQSYDHPAADSSYDVRRHPRLHHVRGHLVRRGNRIFWRLPHLRGSARFGTIRTRTVVWSFESDTAREAANPGLARPPGERSGRLSSAEDLR